MSIGYVDTKLVWRLYSPSPSKSESATSTIAYVNFSPSSSTQCAPWEMSPLTILRSVTLDAGKISTGKLRLRSLRASPMKWWSHSGMSLSFYLHLGGSIFDHSLPPMNHITHLQVGYLSDCINFDIFRRILTELSRLPILSATKSLRFRGICFELM